MSHSSNDGDYLEDTSDAWWHQLDLEARRYQEELKARFDRQQLDHQQKDTDHDQINRRHDLFGTGTDQE